VFNHPPDSNKFFGLLFSCDSSDQVDRRDKSGLMLVPVKRDLRKLFCGIGPCFDGLKFDLFFEAMILDVFYNDFSIDLRRMKWNVPVSIFAFIRLRTLSFSNISPFSCSSFRFVRPLKTVSVIPVTTQIANALTVAIPLVSFQPRSQSRSKVCLPHPGVRGRGQGILWQAHHP